MPPFHYYFHLSNGGREKENIYSEYCPRNVLLGHYIGEGGR